MAGKEDLGQIKTVLHLRTRNLDCLAMSKGSKWDIGVPSRDKKQRTKARRSVGRQCL